MARTEPIVCPFTARTAPPHQAYLGIPYARPPLGPLRFAPPQPAAAWTATRNATAFGDACLQDSRGLLASMYGPQSEDCLTINVFVPPRVSSSGGTGGLHVMVWIYGGRFWSGATQGTAYDSRFLANQTGAV